MSVPEENRNVNLEEIDTDSLFGIEQLKHQSILQKVIFFGCLILGVLINILIPLLLPDIPNIVRIVLFIALAFTGILFGANYNQDMSLFRYFVYVFTKRNTPFIYESSEDIESIRKNIAKQKEMEDEILSEKKAYDKKESIRSIKKLLILGVIILVVIIAVFIIFNILNPRDLMHHRI